MEAVMMIKCLVLVVRGEICLSLRLEGTREISWFERKMGNVILDPVTPGKEGGVLETEVRSRQAGHSYKFASDHRPHNSRVSGI